jgi:hypothetical protein
MQKQNGHENLLGFNMWNQRQQIQPGCDIEDRGIGEKVKDNDAIEMSGTYLSFRTTFSILNPQRMILKFFQRVTKPSLSLFLLLKSVLFF